MPTLLFVTLALQLMTAAVADSVTVDEFAHVPVGLYLWQTGDVALDSINPPLGRMLAALPILGVEHVFAPPPGLGALTLGLEFLNRNSERYHGLFVLARCTVVLATLALALLVLRFASRLFDPIAAVAALFVFSLHPDVLAHGHLATVDMFGALAWLYVVWRTFLLGEILVARDTSRVRLIGGAFALGAALGAAVLFKLSNILLIAVVAALLAIDVARATTSYRLLRRLSVTLTILIIGFLLVVNAGFLGRGTLTRLGDLEFPGPSVPAALARAVPSLRLPVPAPLLQGIDHVQGQGKHYSEETTTGLARFYLDGRLSADGWWNYHLLAFLYKTPLALLLLLALAGLGLLWSRGSTDVRTWTYLLLPVAVIFFSTMVLTSLDLGVRHLLPAYPELCIAGGWPLAELMKPKLANGARFFPRLRVSMAVVLGAALLIAPLSVAPRYLQFFNVLAGGPEQGHRHLVDSNLDWGQDLVRLRQAIDTREWNAIDLAYFGLPAPEVYGIQFRFYDGHLPLDAPTVVSANFLMGRSYWTLVQGQPIWVDASRYRSLREIEPSARIGSMFLFLPEKEAR